MYTIVQRVIEEYQQYIIAGSTVLIGWVTVVSAEHYVILLHILFDYQPIPTIYYNWQAHGDIYSELTEPGLQTQNFCYAKILTFDL